MRRIILLLLLWISWAALLLPGHVAQAQGAAVLSGKIARATSDSVLVSWYPQPLDPHEQTVGVLPNKRGEFSLSIPVTAPVMAELRYGDEETPLFLEPGDALEVKFKVTEMATTVKFESADGSAHRAAANANNYLTEFETKFTNTEGYQVLPENIELYEAPFLSFLAYRRKQQQDLLRKAGGGKDFTPAFAAYAQADIDYSYANDRLTFPDLREQVVATEGRLKLSPNFYDFLKDPAEVPGNEAALANSQVQEFMLNYVHQQVRESGVALTAPGYYPACYQLAARTFQGALRPLVMGRVLLETFRFGHFDHATALLDDYAATAKAPAAWVALLRRDFEAHQALAIGAPAPPLPLNTAQGDSLRLAVYKGKLIYVMFWDSRLPQSQREMPYLKQVLKEFAGKPIVFVSAAFDEGAGKRLPPNAPEGSLEPGVVPPAERPVVRQRYDIETLPSFMLLAEDGTVLDPNPKRLSSRALLDDLKAAFGRAAAYRAVALPKK